MIAFLHQLFASNFCTPLRVSGGRRPSIILSLEQLEERATPATLLPQAFVGLNMAEINLISMPPLVPPVPTAPAQFNAPVFALNYQTPPSPLTPLQALIGAFDQFPPTPIHSPVFFGVETFLSGGITIGGGGTT